MVGHAAQSLCDSRDKSVTIKNNKDAEDPSSGSIDGISYTRKTKKAHLPLEAPVEHPQLSVGGNGSGSIIFIHYIYATHRGASVGCRPNDSP